MISPMHRDVLRTRIDNDVVPTRHRLVKTAEAIADNNPFGMPPPAIEGPYITPTHPMMAIVVNLEILRTKCALDARPLVGLAARAYAQCKVYETLLDTVQQTRSGMPPSGPFEADHLFLGTSQLAVLAAGADALVGTAASNMISRSHICTIGELFHNLACERLDHVVAYVRERKGMEQQTRELIDIGRMPYDPAYGVTPLEWEHCRNIGRALDTCAREIPGSAAFYAAVNDLYVISMRVWDRHLGLADPTINNALSAVADFVHHLPEIARDVYAVTGLHLTTTNGL